MSLTLFRRVLPFIKGGWYSGWYGFSNFILVGTTKPLSGLKRKKTSKTEVFEGDLSH